MASRFMLIKLLSTVKGIERFKLELTVMSLEHNTVASEMGKMKSRTLGRTGLKVSELSLGGLFMASFAAEFEKAKSTVLRALELGVNYVDTAPTYGNSEEVLGKILGDISMPVTLSTKLGGRPKPFNPQDKDYLMG